LSFCIKLGFSFKAYISYPLFQICLFLKDIQHNHFSKLLELMRDCLTLISSLINADVNAAYNILMKSDPQALPSRRVGGVGGYVMYPLRVSYQAMKL